MFSNIKLKALRQINNAPKKNFAYGVKLFKVSVLNENNKSITKTPTESFEIKAPMEHLLSSAGNCEIHSIQFFAKKNSVRIEKIEIDLKGEFDTDVFLGDKEGRNTFTKIDVEFRIHSTEKDKVKLEEIVKKGIEKCPAMNTLKLAGIEINKNINYL